MLLVPPVAQDDGLAASAPVCYKVCSTSTFVLETEVTAPKMDQLRAALRRLPYKGLEAEAQAGALAQSRCTFEELLDCVQASSAEIRKGLEQLHAMDIDGRWCLVDEDLVGETFGAILDVVSGESRHRRRRRHLLLLLPEDNHSSTLFPSLPPSLPLSRAHTLSALALLANQPTGTSARPCLPWTCLQAVEFDLPMDAVPAASCIEKLTDCEPRLVKHCLANFSLNQTAPPPEDDLYLRCSGFPLCSESLPN